MPHFTQFIQNATDLVFICGVGGVAFGLLYVVAGSAVDFLLGRK
jgi:hypothetical protein